MTGRPETAATDPMHLQAAAWFARKRAGDMTRRRDRGAERLARRRPRPPGRLRAAGARLERASRSARGDPRIIAMREQALKRGAGRPQGAGLPRRGRLRWRSPWSRPRPAEPGALMGLIGYGSLANQSYRTGVGQQATVTLPDGSVVTLNTDTRLRTRAAERQAARLSRPGPGLLPGGQGPAPPVRRHRRRPHGDRPRHRLRRARRPAASSKVTLVEGKVRVEAPPPARRACRPAPARRRSRRRPK